MVVAVSLIFIVLYLVIAIRSSKSEASFSTLTVFGLGAFLYYVAIPLEMSLRGLDHFVLSGEIINVNALLQFKIALMGGLALVGFALGYRASGFKPFDLHPSIHTPGTSKPSSVAVPSHVLVLTALTILALLLFYSNELTTISTYQGHYTTVYSSPVFSLLGELAVLGVALTAAILSCRVTRARPVLGALLTVPIFVWGVYSSDKDPMVIGALAIGTGFVKRTGKYQLRTLLVLVLIVAALGPLLQLFSTYRAHLFLTREDIRFDGLMLDRDPMGPLVSLVETVDARNLKLRYGTTFTDSVLLLVPKAVWPGRPMDLAEQFIRDRMSTAWQPGMGMGYSLLAESYLNFGWLGPLLQYGLMGWLWGLAWRLVQRNFLTVHEAYWKATYCTVGFYTLLVMHRAPASFPVKHTAMIVIGLMAARSTLRLLRLDNSGRPESSLRNPRRIAWVNHVRHSPSTRPLHYPNRLH